MQSIQPLLGKIGLDSLIRDLELFGLQLNDNTKSYSLAEIETALEQTFGEASRLFMERIKNALAEC